MVARLRAALLFEKMCVSLARGADLGGWGVENEFPAAEGRMVPSENIVKHGARRVSDGN